MNNNELSDCSKNLICKELDVSISTAVANFKAGGVISDEAIQSLCSVFEAIFIHGLKDAFFLKGSRYSKYPEPNFWPFVSKFTHKSVRNHIASLKQIRNEVGRARAWIRVVLNENVLENYVSILAADKNQLRVFYQKSAFLRDHERVDAVIMHLKTLSQVHFNVPTNSSFLNTWTPTVLIMAGLCGTRASNAIPSRRLFSNGPSFSHKSKEGGNASSADMTSDAKFHKMNNHNALFMVGSPQSRSEVDDEEDDRSSVYSHPSLLDGGITNALPMSARVGAFNSTLSCTPENAQFPDTFAGDYSTTVADEPSAEVIVRRRKTRILKLSRQGDGTRSRSGNNSGDMSHAESQAGLTDASNSSVEFIRASGTASMEAVISSANYLQALSIPAEPASEEPSDSGYGNDDRRESPSMSMEECLSGENPMRQVGEDNNIYTDRFANETFLSGSSLHDGLRALNMTRDDSASSLVSSLGHTSGSVPSHCFASSAVIDCSSANPSCSSLFNIDYSSPNGSFNTAFRCAVNNSDLFFNAEAKRKISQCSSTASGGSVDFASSPQSHEEELSAKSESEAFRKVSTASTWSNPTVRLIRQLERRAKSLAPAESATPPAFIAGDRHHPFQKSLSVTSVLLNDDRAIAAGKQNSSQSLVTLAQNEFKPALPQVPSPPQAAKVITTRNVFTGEDIVMHLLTQTPELPHMPLEIERPTLDDDVVVVDHTVLMEADEYGVSQDLLRITRIPVELGLDAQEFRCPSCRKSIGGSFGLFRMCNLDCRYYCEDCWRRGDESIIPARMIWNWDCRRRPICKASRAFLKSISDRPFIRIDKLNPSLYEHSRLMERIKSLRIKLSLAVMYLLSCKQSVAEDVRRRIFPHDYYHNDIHLYSVMDLTNVLNGAMEKRLNTLIVFCMSHVNECPLCFQKGFVCEICQSRRVIYPFQTEIVHRCKDCFAVYHMECVKNRDCPKCERRAMFRAPDFQPFSPPPLKDATFDISVAPTDKPRPPLEKEGVKFL